MGCAYDVHVGGRFLSNDPVGFLGHLSGMQGAQGFNRYAYVNNNPYKYTDPTGEVAWLFIPMAVSIASSVAGNLAEQIASGGDIDMGSVGKAAATGAVAGVLGGVGAAVKA